MSEFEDLLRQTAQRQQQERADRQAAQQASNAAVARQVAERLARLGKRPYGTDPAVIFAERTPLVVSFMATMISAGLPGSTKIAKEYVAPPARKGLFATVLLSQTPQAVIARGYQIGINGTRAVYLCEDNRLRLEDGSALQSEAFEAGAGNNADFRGASLEDTLLALAAKHLPSADA